MNAPDSNSAETSIAAAELASTRLRQKGLKAIWPFVPLGILQAVLVFTLGPRSIGPGGMLSYGLVALPAVLFMVYTSVGAVKARHHVSVYAILTAALWAIIAIACTVGRFVLHDSLVWWICWALVSAGPYAAAVGVEAGRRRRLGGAIR